MSNSNIITPTQISDIPPDSEGFSGNISPFKQEFEEYLKLYPGRGTLKVQISTAKEAFPIKDAVVSISVNHNGKRYLLYNDVTDMSGIVDNIILPARSVQNSLSFATAGDEARYFVSIYHPGFQPIINCKVTIYDKIETILPISLVPIARDEVSS